MKKMSLFTQLMTILFFTSFLMIGCKKETSDSGLTPQQEEEVATVSTESETEQEFAFNDVFDNVIGVNDEVGLSGTGVFGKRAPDGTLETARLTNIDSNQHCFVVIVTRLTAGELFPVKIVIDFGTGCTDRNGHTRYGKIITVYTGRLTVPGKSATTTFDGYKIDSLSIQGKHVITNTSSSNKMQFTVDVTDARIGKPNGNYSEWESHRVTTQIEGNGTPLFPLDDIFSVKGAAHGKVKRGDHLYAWQSEITEPLIKKFTCPWISKGILKVRRETLSTTSQWVAVLNYGNGDCDNKATLTINGIEHQITLH